MKFESVKCDECGRIQDVANHWLKLLLVVNSARPSLLTVTLGDLEISTEREFGTERDLCGQHCAMKHIAKLLGWSNVLEAGKD